jgi:hypothetical protein
MEVRSDPQCGILLPAAKASRIFCDFDFISRVLL